MVKAKFPPYVHPSHWALELEPPTYAPSSKWSNKDMDHVAQDLAPSHKFNILYGVFRDDRKTLVLTSLMRWFY